MTAKGTVGTTCHILYLQSVRNCSCVSKSSSWSTSRIARQMEDEICRDSSWMESALIESDKISHMYIMIPIRTGSLEVTASIEVDVDSANLARSAWNRCDWHLIILWWMAYFLRILIPTLQSAQWMTRLLILQGHYLNPCLVRPTVIVVITLRLGTRTIAVLAVSRGRGR
jgi:hypothetical protein